MERTRDLASTLAAVVAGVMTALAYLGLYVAVTSPVAEVLRQLA